MLPIFNISSIGHVDALGVNGALGLLRLHGQNNFITSIETAIHSIPKHSMFRNGME